MTKRVIASFLLFLFNVVSGCSNGPVYTISDDYRSVPPRTVVVLPVGGTVEDANVKRLFRLMTFERLKSMNYAVFDLEEVDEKYLRLGSGRFKEMSPAEVSKLFGADAVLYTTITEWEEKLLVTYASLEIEADFELFSRKGKRLWEATYSTKESDIKMDKTTIEVTVIKVYEPRIQRIVDAAFSTLPFRPGGKEEKRFFDWLPEAGS